MVGNQQPSMKKLLFRVPTKFNSSPLKNDGKGRQAFPIGARELFRGGLLNFGGGGYSFIQLNLQKMLGKSSKPNGGLFFVMEMNPMGSQSVKKSPTKNKSNA